MTKLLYPRAGGFSNEREKRSTAQEELLAKEFLLTHDQTSSEMCYQSNIAEWRYSSDITDENQRLKVCLLFFVHYIRAIM